MAKNENAQSNVPIASIVKSTRVSVIIPTYYRYEFLERLLNDLSTQTHMPDEVLVVDQTAPSDRPDGFYRSFPQLPLTVLFFSKPSQSVPRNIGAACAKNDVLLFMDDDVIIPNDLIENHLVVMERERVDGTSGATSHSAILPLTYPWDKSAMDPIRVLTASPNYKYNGMTIGINGLNFMVKRETLKVVGGFDPFIPRFTDHELGIRLFFSGAKIYHTYDAG